MNVKELQTARRLGTPSVTVIWVDGGYGSIRWKQEARFGRAFGVEFGNPDFVQLAQALGLRAFPIVEADDFAPALTHALTLEEPSIIAVPVDYAENHRPAETLGEVQISM